VIWTRTAEMPAAHAVLRIHDDGTALAYCRVEIATADVDVFGEAPEHPDRCQACCRALVDPCLSGSHPRRP
jgi:hypothetical protein